MNLSEYEGQYIGNREIENVELLEGSETYLGNERVKVVFTNEEEEEFPAEVLNDIVTEEQSDDTELREARVKPVVEKMLITITEAEIPLENMDYVLNKLQWSIEQNFESVIKQALGKEKGRSSLYDWEQFIQSDKD